jgi:hypothetical protein
MPRAIRLRATQIGTTRIAASIESGEIRDKCIGFGTAHLFKQWPAELRNPLAGFSMVARWTSFLPARHGRGNST